MNKVLTVLFVIVGFYGLLTWAADNPGSVKKLHQKVDSTVSSTVDKGERAVGELGK